jgi:uncharacterized glyoxalase superfamily protein PhnB
MTGWGVTPAIRVTEMAGALEFYVGRLGFKVERGGPTETNCAICRGDARLMLEVAADHYGDAYNAAIRQRLGSVSPTSLYIEAPDLEELYGTLDADGTQIIDPLADRVWGQAEFTVEDPDGNWLTFWRATA